MRYDLFCHLSEIPQFEFYSINFTQLPPDSQIQFLIGDLGYLLNDEIGNILDKLCKEFLNNVFSRRSQLTSS